MYHHLQQLLVNVCLVEADIHRVAGGHHVIVVDNLNKNKDEEKVIHNPLEEISETRNRNSYSRENLCNFCKISSDASFKMSNILPSRKALSLTSWRPSSLTFSLSLFLGICRYQPPGRG